MRIEEVTIWAGDPPGSSKENYPWETYKEEWPKAEGRQDALVRWVTVPTVRIYRDDDIARPRPCLIICPGGGYTILEIEREGYALASEVYGYGVIPAVLKYRHFNKSVAIQDLHRAIRYLRTNAHKHCINPDMIGIGGFSAGGHLAINAIISDEIRLYREHYPTDDVDKASRQVSFLFLVYPGVTAYNDRYNKPFPPTFIACTFEDEAAKLGQVMNFYNQLLIDNVPSELHVFTKGRHGVSEPDVSFHSWRGLFKKWLEDMGVIQ